MRQVRKIFNKKQLSEDTILATNKAARQSLTRRFNAKDVTRFITSYFEEYLFHIKPKRIRS